MADVWIMTSDMGEGGWQSGVQVVVLPNRKVLAKNDMDKELIEEQIKEAQERYEHAGSSGPIPTDELFYYLEGLHKSPYHLGAVVPIEEAREYVKLSGGIPLDDFPTAFMNSLYTRLAYSTDTGRVREHNEDAFGFVSPEEFRDIVPAFLPTPIQTFAVVADGMGGLAAGEVASSIAVTTIVDKLKRICKAWPTLEAMISSGQISLQELLTQQLKRALEEANELVILEGERDPSKGGMGTTCTAAALSYGRLLIAHIGDSRAYLLRSGVLAQLTHDHSWVQKQVDKGRITAEEAWDHPRKNLITRAIGLDHKVDVDTYVSDVFSGDLILLCTDGLNTMLKDREIEDVLASGKSLQEICDSLVQAANDVGGFDNTTVMLMEVRAD